MSQNVSLKGKDSFQSTHTILLSYLKIWTIIFLSENIKYSNFQLPYTFLLSFSIRIKIKSTHCDWFHIFYSFFNRCFHIFYSFLYWCFHLFHWFLRITHTVSEKAMAPHSSTLAWKIPWMEEPGRLQSMGSLRVGHDWSDLAAYSTHISLLHG